MSGPEIPDDPNLFVLKSWLVLWRHRAPDRVRNRSGSPRYEEDGRNNILSFTSKPESIRKHKKITILACDINSQGTATVTSKAYHTALIGRKV
ncbi:hypothetical protein PoB_000831000 [Plakobranchus ocellatus]|uniref:Uncharacterized protein n=1 Tax=Plakobranchus ocellatus TaxID=259542 RepID=A0AAV3YH14_9GAST|nr:hypothetical protein PoB_000831000 [Plakobranchus ocellatus]